MIDVTSPESRAKFYASTKWRQLRLIILERDNYECLWCKENGKVNDRNTVVLEVDHIVELEHHPEFALTPMNLRTLCKDCHNKRHKRFNHRPNKAQRWNDEWFGD